MTQKMISASSREEIEKNIDAFLAEGRKHKGVDLVMPAAGSATRFEYRGLYVREWRFREWHGKTCTRFDSAVELLD